MAGISSLVPTVADLGKTKSWVIAGVGLVLGASLAWWAIAKAQDAGLNFNARSYMSNTMNMLPNSPYRSFGSSVRFSATH